MKAHSPVSNTTNAQSSKPFFNKKGGEAAFNNETSFFQKNDTPVQAKLNVGRPNDKYEQEADHVADKVVQRLHDPQVQTKPVTATTPVTPFVQTKCAECEKEETLQQKEEGETTSEPPLNNTSPPPADVVNEDRDDGVVQMCSCHTEKDVQKKGEDNSEDESIEPGLEERLSATEGQGAALPDRVRGNMETAMGADLSGVRIHTGSNAVQMNQGLHAQAFTHGNNIYFNEGRYDTNSAAGQHLLAHELTHTIQQGAVPRQQPVNELAETNNTLTPEATVAPVEPAATAAAPEVTTPAATPEAVAAQPETPATNYQATPQGNEAPPIVEGAPSPAQAEPAAVAGEPAPQQQGTHIPAETNAAAAPEAVEQMPAGEPAQESREEQSTGSESEEGLLMNRLAQADESPVKQEAQSQVNFIRQDALMSEMAANRIAFRRSVEYSAYFGTVRENITGFVLDRILQVQLSLINSRQFLLMNAEAVRASISAMVTGALTRGLTASLQYLNNITSFVTGTQQNITQTISGIAGRITGLVQGISLPDLPGVETIRNSIVSIINRITGYLNAALDTVVNFITSMLQRAMSAIALIVQKLNQFVNQLLDIALAAVNRLISMVFGYLERIGAAIISTLMRILNNTVFPVLRRVERMILQKIELTRRQIIRMIRKNFRQALQNIVDTVSPDPAVQSSAQDQNSMPLTIQQQILHIGSIAYQFANANAFIIDDFEQKTASLFAILVQQLLSAIQQVKLQIQLAIARIAVRIAQFILRMIEQLGRIIDVVVRAVERIIQFVIDAFTRLYDAIVNLIGNPVRALQLAAQNVWDRVQSFIRDAISNFVTGGAFDVNSLSGGSRALFAPPTALFAPALLAPPVVVVEIIVITVITVGGITIAFAEGLVAIGIGGVVVVMTVEVFIAILIILAIIIIIILIIIAILLYLLVKAILKPAPLPVPAPKPVPGPKPGPVPGPGPKPKPKPKPKKCLVYPLGYHRGGNTRHNNCADKVPPNLFPGSDIEVLQPTGVRKSFDAIDPGQRLWEVKTHRYQYYPTWLQRITINRSLTEIAIEMAIAKACGHDYVYAVTDPKMFKDLKKRIPPGVTLLLIKC